MSQNHQSMQVNRLHKYKNEVMFEINLINGKEFNATVQSLFQLFPFYHAFQIEEKNNSAVLIFAFKAPENFLYLGKNFSLASKKYD